MVEAATDLPTLAEAGSVEPRIMQAILTASPEIPSAMGDREGDIPVPLLAIADDAGLTWPPEQGAHCLVFSTPKPRLPLRLAFSFLQT